MRLLRYRLRPLSPWLTPWQADTLTGLLCCILARREGRERMYAEIQEPALRGEPPFVLSDAFPGDLLPLPLSARLQAWPPAERKAVKRVRWLARPAWLAAQAGRPLTAQDLVREEPLPVHDRWRNAIGRAQPGAGGEDGALFASAETSLAPSASAPGDSLSVYARVHDPAWIERLGDLLHDLSDSGFGADASLGRGQFELLGEPEDVSALDAVPPSATGCVSLSTFQPAPHDPSSGCWESFVKHGRLGPDLGVEDVFKRPLLLLRPGAVFAARPPTLRLGRAVPMPELLSPATAASLAARGVAVAHLAFGLALPFAPPPVAAAPSFS